MSKLQGRGSEAVPRTRRKAARVGSDLYRLLLLLPQDHRGPSALSGARRRVGLRLERLNTDSCSARRSDEPTNRDDLRTEREGDARPDRQAEHGNSP